ncbi:F-box protein family [Quillaja saponaria]|uniref:F-box protein family n=1 Tax=Quillaja saponaria TaxID=32244 RepID=A0AAD7VG96_QUISA|nr:F-box protein family [Quillaja saponaria]
MVESDSLWGILLKLPVKSLVLFKCVSKYWNGLLLSPMFIAKHLKIHKNSISHLLLKRCYHPDDEPFISFLSEEPTEVIKDVYLPFPKQFCVLDLYGPCNGILFLVAKTLNGDHEIALWNPTIKQFKLVLEYNVNDVTFSFLYVGFGFDPKSDDYKVIRIRRRVQLGSHSQFVNPHVPLVELYSLNTDSWSVHYWWAVDVLLAFDFSDEEFKTIPLPEEISDRCWPYNEIRQPSEEAVAVLNGSLALVLGYQVVSPKRPKKKFEIWVMDKNDNTWFNYLSIGPSSKFRYLVGIGKDDKFLFVDYDGWLAEYDSRSERTRELEMFTYKHSNQVIVCMETIVSVKGRVEPLVHANISLSSTGY